MQDQKFTLIYTNDAKEAQKLISSNVTQVKHTQENDLYTFRNPEHKDRLYLAARFLERQCLDALCLLQGMQVSSLFKHVLIDRNVDKSTANKSTAANLLSPDLLTVEVLRTKKETKISSRNFYYHKTHEGRIEIYPGRYLVRTPKKWIELTYEMIDKKAHLTSLHHCDWYTQEKGYRITKESAASDLVADYCCWDHAYIIADANPTDAAVRDPTAQAEVDLQEALEAIEQHSVSGTIEELLKMFD